MFGRLSITCVMLLKPPIYVIGHPNIDTTINFTLYGINKINFIHYTKYTKIPLRLACRQAGTRENIQLAISN